MAPIDDEFSTAAATVFQREYSHKTGWIYGGFLFPNDTNELLNVAGMEIDAGTIVELNKRFQSMPESTSNVTMTLFNTNDAQVLNFFKHFGHLIKKNRHETPHLCGRRTFTIDWPFDQ